ncbi:hypothetical protein X737_40170 [Mesorhizobium sp. L48C026A00]|nr:hypothetical protein X737_40170 [Mesorhizobium sp. L48C026A00]
MQDGNAMLLNQTAQHLWLQHIDLWNHNQA